MHLSAIPGTALTAVSSSQPTERIFDYLQRTREGGGVVGLGRTWAAKPQSLTVAGKTYPAKELDAFWVWLPILPESLVPATVNLANGVSVPITLRVSTVR